MPFSREVADVVLVRCARRCCICRKFCGPRMQTHHIVQEADGGDDTLDNCIPLCLDCHAEVNSYNSQHPIGRKYTSDELKKHRDVWFDFVKQHPDRLNNSTEKFFRVVPEEEVPKELSADAKRLLTEVSRTPYGTIRLTQGQGREWMSIEGSTNQQFLGRIDDPREEARWKEALNELVQANYLQPSSHNRYKITHSGYEEAKVLDDKPRTG